MKMMTMSDVDPQRHHCCDVNDVHCELLTYTYTRTLSLVYEHVVYC